MLRISDTLLQNFMSDITSHLKAIEIEKKFNTKINKFYEKNWNSL